MICPESARSANAMLLVAAQPCYDKKHPVTYFTPVLSPFIPPLASLGELIPFALADLGIAGVSKADLRFAVPAEGR